MSLNVDDSGIPHVLIDDGRVNEFNLKRLGKERAWLEKELKRNGLTEGDVFLMTVDDIGSVYIIRKDAKRRK